MCRILAISSMKPIPSSFLVEFRSLAEKGKVWRNAREPGHRDGWGVVLYEHGTPIHLGRRPDDASDDPEYETACRSLDESAGAKGPLLAYLRKASPEYGNRNLENTGPFVSGKWSFAHNGTIFKFNKEVAGLKGNTDSERYFLLLLRTSSENSRSVAEALRLVTETIRESYKYTSLTFVLSDGARIYAYREYADPRDSDYYNLMFSVDSKMAIVTQEALWSRDWVEIPNRTLVTILRNRRLHLETI